MQMLDKPTEKSDIINDTIREQLLEHSKSFKTSWLSLGQTLYSVWRDKLYHSWGFEKFEHYTERELGIKKQVSMRLLKTYLFLEEDEPDYLNKGFAEERDAAKVPGYEEINVLRLARQNKDLMKDDYRQIKKSVFDKGKNASVLRKELTALMKERKPIDPEEERDKRNELAIKKLVSALSSFEKDMEVLKLIPGDLIEDAKKLLKSLKGQVT